MPSQGEVEPGRVGGGRRSYAFALAVALAPAALYGEGLLESARPAFLACACLLLFWLLAEREGKGPLLVIALWSTIATLLAGDLALRAVGDRLVYYRPHERYARPHPDFPQLTRYAKDVDVRGLAYGDLAAMTGNPAYREWRPMAFRTDAYGFRNEPGREHELEDGVILGDSFGSGEGTSLELTWGARLAERTGLSFYNLSLPATPVEEYLNLSLELPRLQLRPGSLLLWMLFTGNDLDEPYTEPLDPRALVRSGPLERRRLAFHAFRRRAPMLRFLERTMQTSALDRGEVLVRSVKGRPILFYRPYLEAGQRLHEGVLRHPQFEKLSAAVAATASLARARRMRTLLIVAPTKEEVYRWMVQGEPPWSTPVHRSGFAEAAGELARRSGLEFVDLAPELVQAARQAYASEGALLFWRDDSHWSARGNAVVADVLARRLAEAPPGP